LDPVADNQKVDDRHCRQSRFRVTAWRYDRPDCQWQRASFHHRIRSDESAEERRAYMIENPVRAGLVQRARDWPYGGQVFKPGSRS